MVTKWGINGVRHELNNNCSLVGQLSVQDDKVITNVTPGNRKEIQR